MLAGSLGKEAYKRFLSSPLSRVSTLILHMNGGEKLFNSRLHNLLLIAIRLACLWARGQAGASLWGFLFGAESSGGEGSGRLTHHGTTPEMT